MHLRDTYWQSTGHWSPMLLSILVVVFKFWCLTQQKLHLWNKKLEVNTRFHKETKRKSTSRHVLPLSSIYYRHTIILGKFSFRSYLQWQPITRNVCASSNKECENAQHPHHKRSMVVVNDILSLIIVELTWDSIL